SLGGWTLKSAEKLYIGVVTSLRPFWLSNEVQILQRSKLSPPYSRSKIHALRLQKSTTIEYGHSSHANRFHFNPVVAQLCTSTSLQPSRLEASQHRCSCSRSTRKG